jgi:phage host-nuclease inhibitor protein Gam
MPSTLPNPQSTIRNPKSEAPLKTDALARLQGMVAEYADNVHARETRKALMEQELDAVRARYQPEIETLTETADGLFANIRVFCTSNRELLFSKKKSLNLLRGTVKFQAGKVFVELLGVIKEFGEGAWHTALQNLESLDWGAPFIRTVREIDKDAIIQAVKDKSLTTEQLAEAGLTVAQKERFSIQPKTEEVPTRA